MKLKHPLLTLFAGAVTVAASNAAVTIVNPGFESPFHSANNGTNPIGWTVIEPASGANSDRKVRTKNDIFHSGLMGLQIGAGQSIHDGRLYQTVTTVPGQMYVFSAWARTNNTNAPNTQNPRFDLIDGVGLGGSTLASSGSVTTLSPTWAEITFSFTASTTATTIHILDVSSAAASDFNDIILDDLSITEVVPEPSSALLGVLGCLLLGFRRNRN